MSFFPGKFLNSFNVLVKELEAPIWLDQFIVINSLIRGSLNVKCCNNIFGWLLYLFRLWLFLYHLQCFYK
jgi:hypothetical protein